MATLAEPDTRRTVKLDAPSRGRSSRAGWRCLKEFSFFLHGEACCLARGVGALGVGGGMDGCGMVWVLVRPKHAPGGEARRSRVARAARPQARTGVLGRPLLPAQCPPPPARSRSCHGGPGRGLLC